MAKFKVGDRVKVVSTKAEISGVRRLRQSLTVGDIHVIQSVGKTVGWDGGGLPAGPDGSFTLADHAHPNFFYEGQLFELADEVQPMQYEVGDTFTMTVTVKKTFDDGSVTFIKPDGTTIPLSKTEAAKNLVLKEKAPKPKILPKVGKKISWKGSRDDYSILWMDDQEKTLLIQKEGHEPVVRSLEDLPEWEVK